MATGNTYIRSRLYYTVLLGLTICVGLFSRSSFVHADTVFGRYAGDILWASAVFWSIAAVFPKCSPWRLASITAIISYAVELSQLYHAEWIEQIRAMKLGGLILGFSFYWPDLICYTVGAVLAGMIDHHILRKERSSPWQWWLMSGLKEKFICWGIFGLLFCGLMLSLNLLYYKILGTSCALLVVGLCMKSEDSTDI
ncbi:MAG: DUF2809 domain-containing protein [Akkermansiaceae bacterium]